MSKLGIKSQKVGLDGLLSQEIICDLLSFLTVAVDNKAADHLIRLFDMMNLGVRDIFLFAQWSKYISKKITSDPTSLSIVDCFCILPPVNWCPDCADSDEYKSATEYRGEYATGW